MKRTYTINVGGKGFVIDDDAYEMLNDYLNTLTHIFERNDDGRELVEEMEGRISEMLSEQLSLKGASIIGKSDVEMVITRMGKPEEFMEYDETFTQEETNSRNCGSMPPPPVPPVGFLKKRLYRDPNNKMIGGVCSGIAQFFNIDPTVVRLIYCAISLASIGTFALLYLILWVIIPEANTPMERMQMKGETPSMENVSRNFSNVVGSANITGEKVNSLADGIVKFFGIIGKICVVIFGIIAWPVGIACLIGIIGCIFTLIMYFANNGYVWWTGIAHANLLSNEITIGSVCGILGCIIVMVPCIFLIYQFMNAGQPEKRMGTAWKATLLIIWSLAIAGMAVTIGIGTAAGWIN